MATFMIYVLWELLMMVNYSFLIFLAVCDAQSIKFNSIYNIAFYGTAIAELVSGIAVDAIGAKLTAIFSGFVFYIYI